MTEQYLNHPSFPWLKNRTVFLCKHGSQAYGTSVPGSDLDVRGVAIAPMEHYLGLMPTFEQAETKGDPDVVVYDIRKFFRLAFDANPNIFEILFSNESDILLKHHLFDNIRYNRHLFLSKKVKHTYLGYATQLMKRIGIAKENLDTKDGMHLVRLLRMGSEILETGRVKIKRPDAQELLAVRNGSWDYAQFMGYAADMSNKIEYLAKKSSLPTEPDKAKLNSILTKTIQEFDMGALYGL